MVSRQTGWTQVAFFLQGSRMNPFQGLSNDLKRLIFGFDPTYNELFAKSLHQLKFIPVLLDLDETGWKWKTTDYKLRGNILWRQFEMYGEKLPSGEIIIYVPF